MLYAKRTYGYLTSDHTFPRSFGLKSNLKFSSFFKQNRTNPSKLIGTQTKCPSDNTTEREFFIVRILVFLGLLSLQKWSSCQISITRQRPATQTLLLICHATVINEISKIYYIPYPPYPIKKPYRVENTCIQTYLMSDAVRKVVVAGSTWTYV